MQSSGMGHNMMPPEAGEGVIAQSEIVSSPVKSERDTGAAQGEHLAAATGTVEGGERVHAAA